MFMDEILSVSFHHAHVMIHIRKIMRIWLFFPELILKKSMLFTMLFSIVKHTLQPLV